MPANDKKMNNHLFDQLEIVEEALERAQAEGAKQTIAYLEKKREYINRKLFQNPSVPEQG